MIRLFSSSCPIGVKHCSFSLGAMNSEFYGALNTLMLCRFHPYSTPEGALVQTHRRNLWPAGKTIDNGPVPNGTLNPHGPPL